MYIGGFNREEYVIKRGKKSNPGERGMIYIKEKKGGIGI